MKYSVLIIGAGKQGAFFDNPKSKNILTHAHAFTKHKGFKLLGFVDTNKQKAQEAASIWRGKAFYSLEEAFKKEKVDVVCVVVPDEFHYQILKKLSSFKLELIFTEKPLAKKLAEIDDLLKIYQQKKPVLVNYSRRFLPEFEGIKEKIDEGLYGNFIAGTGYYGKGLLHYGSHLIDLLRWYFGEVKDFQVVDVIDDFTRDDPSFSLILTLNHKRRFFLQAVDCRLFSIFEIDLLFEKRRIVIKDAGAKIEEYVIKENQISKGYKSMVKTRERNIDSRGLTYHAVENIYHFLTKGENLKCDLKEGYKTAKTCIKIYQGA